MAIAINFAMTTAVKNMERGSLKSIIALSAVESWWKNETSKRMAHLRQVRKRDKSRAVVYELNHEKWHIEYNLRFM